MTCIVFIKEIVKGFYLGFLEFVSFFFTNSKNDGLSICYVTTNVL